MPGPAVTLREIHRLRRHAHDMQTQIDRAPRLLQAQRDRAARQEQAYHDAQESLKHLKVANHEKEVTLRTKIQQADKHQQQLNEATSKKEYDALRHEIEAEKKAWGVLEDEILAGLAEVDERAARLPELEAEAKKAKQELAEFEQAQGQRLAELAEQARGVLEEVSRAEADLPEEIRGLYDRLVAAWGVDALSALNGRTCTACYTEITAQSYNDLVREAFVVCKSCGRMLYLTQA